MPARSMWFAFVALFLLPAFVRAADPAYLDAFAAKEFKDDKGALPYRLLTPKGYDAKAGKKYPLVLFLHGAGERGNDNKAQLKHGGAELAGKLQEQEPTFVVAPQCPTNKQWVNTPWAKGSYSVDKVPLSDELRMALAAVRSTMKEFGIDPARVYVMGLSMGGYGTWDCIAREPALFAAAVPICGAGDPTRMEAVSAVPVWAFHGDKDTVVPTQGSRDMVEAIKRAGGAVTYSELPGVGHNAWSPAFAEKGLFPWLLKQKKA